MLADSSLKPFAWRIPVLFHVQFFPGSQTEQVKEKGRQRSFKSSCALLGFSIFKRIPPLLACRVLRGRPLLQSLKTNKATTFELRIHLHSRACLYQARSPRSDLQQRLLKSAFNCHIRECTHRRWKDGCSSRRSRFDSQHPLGSSPRSNFSLPSSGLRRN